jgi:CheY-like chemotaxis protein
MNAQPAESLRRILIVEDEPFCRRLLERYLSSFPVEVRFCADAETGLRSLEEFDPELIFMDLVLPGMDGIEATETIRHRSGFASTPIVVTTTLDDAHVSIDARNAGATSYMAKPLLFPDVVELLGKLLGIAPLEPAPARG